MARANANHENADFRSLFLSVLDTRSKSLRTKYKVAMLECARPSLESGVRFKLWNQIQLSLFVSIEKTFAVYVQWGKKPQRGKLFIEMFGTASTPESVLQMAEDVLAELAGRISLPLEERTKDRIRSSTRMQSTDWQVIFWN